MLLNEHCRQESDRSKAESDFRSEIRGFSREIVYDEGFEHEDRGDGNDIDEPEILDMLVSEIVSE